MYKGRIISATPITANTNIPFVTVWNTNNNTRYSETDNAVELRARGYYDVAVSMTLTNSATSPIAIQLYANGTPIAETVSESDITATTGTHTLTIVDTVRVRADLVNNFAEISVRATNDATVLTGLFTVEMRK